MPAAFTQDNRPLAVSTPLGKDVLLLETLVGEEAVSGPFRFELGLLSENDALDPAQLLGQPVAIRIAFGETTRRIHGVVLSFTQLARGARLTRYRAVVVPKLWWASLRHGSRIFQEQSVPDVVSAVLTEAGVAFQMRVSGSFEPRNYCVQYREPDLRFVGRLLEHEGIHYYHTHAESAHQMVLSNRSQQNPVCPELESVIAIPGESHPQTSPDALAYNLVRDAGVATGKVTLWDHHFELPGRNLEATATTSFGVTELEAYDYPGGFAHFDGISRSGGEQAAELQKIFQENTRVAGLRAQELASRQVLLRGQSNCPLLTAGHRFTLARHYAFDAEYLLTSVRHEATIETYDAGERSPYHYHADFEAVPNDRPYLPPRLTPPARVAGVQTATVVGPSGAEIYTDKYGRVMVQFNWDRQGQRDAQSSCWVRVATPWAGKNWGMIAIPRIGTEVIVDFVEGDPDRPLILGMVYNAESMPPYTLPDNRTQSGIKTRSSLQGAAEHFNELRFEDKKDAEEIYVHAEKDLNAVVENNETRKVGFEKKDKGDQSVEVFNNQTLKVGAGAGDAEDGSQTVSIYKDQTLTLETGNQAITLTQGNRSVTLDQGNETIQLKTGNRTVTLDQGNDGLTLKTGNLTTKLQMGNASMELDMGNASTQAKLGSIAQEAMQAIELKVGQNSIKVDQTGVTIKGMMVKVEGQIQTEVKGLMTTVGGDAMLTVKGGITMIN